MENIIVVFPKIEDGKGIKGLLAKNGFRVDAVCSLGAQALGQAGMLSGGIVICGYKLPDMIYSELKENLPPNFELLLLASERILAECDSDVMSVTMPVKVTDFINTIHMMFEAQARARKKKRNIPKVRSEEEVAVINRAKAVLIERNHMSEAEAHRYIQKCSMDSGTNVVEAAQMVMALFK